MILLRAQAFIFFVFTLVLSSLTVAQVSPVEVERIRESGQPLRYVLKGEDAEIGLFYKLNFEKYFPIDFVSSENQCSPKPMRCKMNFYLRNISLVGRWIKHKDPTKIGKIVSNNLTSPNFVQTDVRGTNSRPSGEIFSSESMPPLSMDCADSDWLPEAWDAKIYFWAQDLPTINQHTGLSENDLQLTLPATPTTIEGNKISFRVPQKFSVNYIGTIIPIFGQQFGLRKSGNNYCLVTANFMGGEALTQINGIPSGETDEKDFKQVMSDNVDPEFKQVRSIEEHFISITGTKITLSSGVEK